jgi:cytochrome bd-type quinol oxidase subunit 2
MVVILSILILLGIIVVHAAWYLTHSENPRTRQQTRTTYYISWAILFVCGALFLFLYQRVPEKERVPTLPWKFL